MQMTGEMFLHTENQFPRSLPGRPFCGGLSRRAPEFAGNLALHR